jgi:acyl-CoA synthetase (AMP-forming)/AMP-acid ligase II/acyl carrier protein
MSDMDDLNIGRALEALAANQPAAPAIHVPGRPALTYADLGAQIRYVRERLAGWDITRNDLIAGVIPSRPEMAVACATIPAAATFAPLNPALTPAKYAEALARLRPKLLVVPNEVDHPIRGAARQCGVAEAGLTAEPGAPAGMYKLDVIRSDASLVGPASSRPDWACVVTTSGTTGRAKLVPMSHRQLQLYSRAVGDWFRLTASDIGANIVPLHQQGVDTGLLVLLLRGASVACLPESDIDAFYAALGEYRITWFTAGPAIHRAILRRAPDFRGIIGRNTLRSMRVGSGRLEPDEMDRIEQALGAPLSMSFGMTEARLISSTALPPGRRKPGSVGVPLCNEVVVRRDTGAVCGPEEAGEIFVRGPLVFDGYFDDAHATAAAFVDGWFRTGDLGRFDADGHLYLAGRKKDIINRGGEKISPAEIDAAIEALTGVRAAATFAVPHPTLGEEIAAAVVKHSGAKIEESDIIERVRQRMGPLRVPRRIYFLDELPRTDSGKLRRAELPRLLGLDRPAALPTGETPPESAVLSPVEAALAGLWATVLQVKSVGAHDDFFLLGGDSLRGARLLTAVKAVFGVELPIQMLFREAATVAGMVRTIETLRLGKAGVIEAPQASPDHG